MARSLYICYFGVQEPLVQTQVLPYLRELVKGGHEMALLTFEPATVGNNENADKENIRTILAEQGIEWHWLRYHKRPSIPATLFDLANGVRAALSIARRKKIDIFHIRGHIPGPIGVIAKQIRGGKVLFDIRGFLPEEYVDAGIWDAKGMVYRSFKRIEKWLMRSVDGFVVLTEKARDILFPEARETGLDRYHRPVEVIPCCLDFSRASIDLDQRDKVRADLGVAERFVLIHVGSLGGLYLTDKIIELMAASRKRDPSTFALFLTRHDASPISDKLRLAGFAEDSYMVKSVRPEEVFYFLVAADAAISIVKESYSSASRSPTKIAEYLAAGLPIISSPNIGDTDSLVVSQGVGVTIVKFEPAEYKKVFDQLSQIRSDKKLRDRCVAVAHEHFDLETIGGPLYRRVYERLLAGDQNEFGRVLESEVPGLPHPIQAIVPEGRGLSAAVQKARSLYICYFGVRETLVQTQVLPYVRELIKGGHEMTLLTFEPAGGDKNEKANNDKIREHLAAEKIEWQWLRYHAKPSVPATLYDIAAGVGAAVDIAKRKGIDIIHVRGHIPAPIGAIVKRICGGKMLFDIRGFMPEEYVDAGVWEKSGAIYKTFKRIERWVMKDADGFVVLTEKAREVLFPESSGNGLDPLGRPVEVIPCCVDLSMYTTDSAGIRLKMRQELELEDKYVVVYVGSSGGFYMTDEMLDFLTTFRSHRPDMFAMILTQREQEKISAALEGRGFKPSEFLVRGVPPNEIARYLSAADVSMSFIKPTYSKQSSSPTKIAEYLAAGLAVISNKGVGDLDQLIEENRVGALVNELNPEGYLNAINRVDALGDVQKRCREVAVREFDLATVGGPRYRRIYERLLRNDR